MSSAVVGSHSGAGPLGLMSCVRESSPLQDFDSDPEKNVSSKKRFWNPKKWFRKKQKVVEEIVVEVKDNTQKESLRSRSTSEISVAEDETRRRSSSSIQQGLSVSHDSVFHSPNSGSDLELDVAKSSSSLSISQPLVDHKLQSELCERLRLRRGRGDNSEDDEGLPHSPCNSPTADKTAIKDPPTKSHSTCSDGSLLSMGSSEMEEDSFGQNSRHSSKLSLHEKRPSEGDDFGTGTSFTPLNHSAAHHRVSVKPKRTHGAPRRKRPPQLGTALPATPEVNEDSSIRSISPDSINNRVTITELYSMSSSYYTESQLKCSSLPPGLVGPGSEMTSLNRSKSSAGSKSQDHFGALEEETEKEEKGKNIFERLLLRRSGKKKKKEEIKKEEKVEKYEEVIETVDSRIESKPIPAVRGPSSRQRIEPIDIPASPEENRKISSGKNESSPIQAELESRFRQKPKSPLFSSKFEPIHFVKSSQVTRHSEHFREESKSKIKIAGLTSYQQRFLQHNEEESPFKSLSDWSSDGSKAKPVTKSHSFKGTKESMTIPQAGRIEADFGALDSLRASKSLNLLNQEVEDQPNVTKTELKEDHTDCTKNVGITISGPTNSFVVNGSGLSEIPLEKEEVSKSVSVVHLRREVTQVTNSVSSVTVPKENVPEFLNKHLNKVESRQSSNVIFSMKSPRIVEDQNRPKTLFNFDVEEKKPIRKFSNNNLEILEKEDKIIESKIQKEVVNVSRYRKNEKNLKKPTTPTTPDSPGLKDGLFRSKSGSLDSVKSEITDQSDKSSQDSLDLLNDQKPKSSPVADSVVRRKMAAKRKDEEPELMKVFARRSLKLKDSETLGQSLDDMLESDPKRDSDKENSESPESKTSLKESLKDNVTELKQKELKDDKTEIKSSPKEPLTETKQADGGRNVKETSSESEVTMRKSNIFTYQRTVSLNLNKTNSEGFRKKQSSFSERKTDQWFGINKEEKNEEDIVAEEILPQPRNFNQRKAEWEKRAQMAQQKN